PRVDVDVRPADGRLADLDQEIIGADLRDGYFLHPDARLRLRLHQRLHARITPICLPAFSNAATARSRWCRSCAADIWVRMRACPCGTTGKEKPMTYTPSARSWSASSLASFASPSI